MQWNVTIAMLLLSTALPAACTIRRVNSLPSTFRMGGEAIQLTTQLTDLAVSEQKKPHDQSELLHRARSTFKVKVTAKT